jgi:lipopolysaccharide transport system ATP-binding protein
MLSRVIAGRTVNTLLVVHRRNGSISGLRIAQQRKHRRWLRHGLQAKSLAPARACSTTLHWSFFLITVTAVRFEGVSKSYAIYDAPSDRLKELLSPVRRKHHRDFWALHDVSFSVERGETFCIIGENGSGKSTLLQIVAGILQPARGTVEVAGRVAALLELGAGFNPEFSGRDNVYLNGSILGLTTRQIDERYKDIEAFAEIGDFINQPVKTYSSGMVVRLAFAVAINVDPEILLVDEALAVGDIYFRQRCMRKVHELRSRGVTILFVSHAVSDVKAIGDRVVWLDRGRVAEIGEPDRVISRYLATMVEKDSAYLLHKAAVEERQPRAGRLQAPEVIETIPNIDHRYGDGRAKVIGIGVFDERGRPLQLLTPATRILVRISVRASDEVPMPIVGFMLRNQLGIDFSGFNTAREGFELPSMLAGDVCTVDFYIDLPELYPASFSFSPAIADGTLMGYAMCDWIDNAVTLQMSRSEHEIYGYLHLPCRVEVNARVRGEAAPEPILVLEKHVG